MKIFFNFYFFISKNILSLCSNIKYLNTKIMTTTQSKTVSSNEIQSVAVLLIAKNGKTTSLEVKQFLRDQGFTVFQNEVSQALIDFQDNNADKISCDDNGSYRTYFKTVEDTNLGTNLGTITVSNDVPSAQTPSNTQPSGRVKVNITPLNTNVNGYSTTQLNDEFDANDWIVFGSAMNTPIAVYASDETRDHIRTHYARLNAMSMSDVRSKRVSNFTK